MAAMQHCAMQGPQRASRRGDSQFLSGMYKPVKHKAPCAKPVLGWRRLPGREGRLSSLRRAKRHRQQRARQYVLVSIASAVPAPPPRLQLVSRARPDACGWGATRVATSCGAVRPLLRARQRSISHELRSHSRQLFCSYVCTPYRPFVLLISRVPIV